VYSPGGQRLGTYQITVYNNGTTDTDLTRQSTLITTDLFFGERRLVVQDRFGSVRSYFPYGNPATWQYGTNDGIGFNGQFADYPSAGGVPPVSTLIGAAFQTFTASGTISEIAFTQPLQINGFGPGTYVLSNCYQPTGVTINGLGIGTSLATECPGH
jgi:hypothetical protein